MPGLIVSRCHKHAREARSDRVFPEDEQDERHGGGWCRRCISHPAEVDHPAVVLQLAVARDIFRQVKIFF
jgi:hypothetical protein